MFKNKKNKLISWLLIVTFLVTFITPINTASAASVAPTIYFQDDFTAGNYSKWTVASGTWGIANDPKNSSNKTLKQTGTDEGIVLAGDSAWTDYTATMRIYTGGGNGYPGLLARVQDSKNFYYFQMQKTGTLVLSRRVNGTDTALKTTSYTMAANTWYTLKMVLVGSSIKCYIVNGSVDKLIFDVTDTLYNSGKIGVRNKWQDTFIDDVMVTDLPAANTSVIQSPAQTVSSISLNWDAVEGATSYNIYRSTTEGSGYAYVGNTATNSYTDTGLTFDTSYYYKMAFLYGGITESQSTAEFTVKTSPAPPATPSVQTVTAINSTKINLGWSSVVKADGYRVYRAVSGSAIGVVTGGSIVYEGTSLTYSDTGLDPNTLYNYYITAFNTIGESAAIAVNSTTYMYDAPSNFAVSSKSDTSVSLNWSAAVTGTAITYYVTKSTSTTGTFNLAYSGAAANFTDNGLTQGTGYYYKIYVVIDGVTSAISDVLGVGTVRTSFTPDTLMVDTNGNPIDAHGAGIMYDKVTEKYYWYGEYHVGKWPGSAVRVYSSSDLYNWKDEGSALTMIPSMDSFTSDPLISSLYAGRTDKAAIFESMRVGRIVERPKVIYNEKTKKYVMWMHMEGYTNADGSQNTSYGKASAGVAISDSPIGPFEYIDDNRMDRCPADQTDSYPSSKGMARDMNLFQDEDGTAYLIYSSEENLTTYISKLTDDYLDITGWHKENLGNDENGVPIRDATYQSVYGVDFVRLFPGAQREAPAMFKYNGKYYLINSGATGWAANTNKYTVADSVFGTWSPLVNPFVRTSASDPDPAKAFNSQATYVIPVDASKGKFIYVGDNWNGGNFANNAAKYIFLPIDFGQDTNMTIRWYSNWTLSALDYAASIVVNTKLPETYATGETLALPDQIQVTINGAVVSTPVTWAANSVALTNSVTFTNPGLYTLQATLVGMNNKIITFKVYSIPEKSIYFVNSSGIKTSDYSFMASYMQSSLINKEVIDQGYSSTNSNPWGYGANTATAGSSTGDLFTTLRYLAGNNTGSDAAGKDLVYKFTVPNGSYTVYTGFNDIWSNTTRKADLYINDVKKTAITFVSNSVYGNTVDVTDGMINITVRNTLYQDPMINWIIVVNNNLTDVDTTAGLQIVSGSNLSWNKAIGAVSYTLYRSAEIDGTYTAIYSGSEASFTDTELTTGKNYFYKVSSTNINNVESSLSDAFSATKIPDAETFGMSATSFLLKGETTVSNVKLQWSTVTGATNYMVSRSQNGGAFKTLQTLSGTTMDDYNLLEGVTYQYKVEAYKGEVLLDTANSNNCQTSALTQDVNTYDNTTSSSLDILSELKVGKTYYRFNYVSKTSPEKGFKELVQQTSTDGITYGDDKVVLSYTDHADLNDCKFESTSIVYNDKTNKFIIWTHYENSSDYTLGRVAVASATPGESFLFIKSFQPFDTDSRDLGFFKDTDGSAYLISSARTNTDTILYKLTSDWLDVEKKVKTIYDDQYREAPCMIKKDGIYYLFTSQAAGWYPSISMYSSAPSLTGPWSELRTIGSPSTFSAQSGGIVHLKGTSGDNYVMMANRWMFGWKDATNPISQQRMLPISFANGFAFFDYYENVLYSGSTGSLIPVQNGKILSQDMPATASSNAETASGANDGVYQTEWVSASNTWPSTWTVDMGTPSYLSSLQISWYMYKGSEAYYQYIVEGSLDGVNYTVLLDKSTGYNDYGFTADDIEGFARYVRVTLVNAKLQNNPSNWYTPQLYEVKVLGEPLVVANPTVVTNPATLPKYGTKNYGTVGVTLSTATSGAAIYYTVDNSTPDKDSTLYTGELKISTDVKEGKTINVKAIAIYAGVSSQVITKAITFLPVPTEDLPAKATVTPTPTPTPTVEKEVVPVSIETSVADGKLKVSVDISADKMLKMTEDLNASQLHNIQLPISSQSIIDQINKKDGNNVEISINIPEKILTKGVIENVNINLEKELLAAAASNKKDVKVAVKDEKGKELYSWSFDGSDLANTKKEISNVNLSLSVEKVTADTQLHQLLASNTGNETKNYTNGVVVNFNYDGVLPAQGAVKIYVGDLVGASQLNHKVYAYHYNRQTQKLETLPYSSEYVVDAAGYITVNLLHCSDYVFLPQSADKSAVTSLIDQVSVTPTKKTLYVGGTKETSMSMVVTLPNTLELVSSLSDKTSSSAIGAATLSYSSKNNKVATIDKTGKITATGVGTTTIITKVTLYSNKTQTFTTVITVKEPYIKLVNSKNTMQVGDSYTFTATAYGLDLTDVMWTTTKASIVSIDKKTGKAIAKSKGTDYVKVVIGKFSKMVKVIVK